jgi:hypothetical protein
VLDQRFGIEILIVIGAYSPRTQIKRGSEAEEDVSIRAGIRAGYNSPGKPTRPAGKRPNLRLCLRGYILLNAKTLRERERQNANNHKQQDPKGTARKMQPNPPLTLVVHKRWLSVEWS